MAASDTSRRDFLKKAAYVAPVVLTMNVSLAQAQVGSARQIPSDSVFLGASSDDGSLNALSLSGGGSRRERRVFRGRGHAYGRVRRDDD